MLGVAREIFFFQIKKKISDFWKKIVFWKQKISFLEKKSILLAFVTLLLPMSLLKIFPFPPIRSSRFVGYREQFYKCLVLLYRWKLKLWSKEIPINYKLYFCWYHFFILFQWTWCIEIGSTRRTLTFLQIDGGTILFIY